MGALSLRTAKGIVKFVTDSGRRTHHLARSLIIKIEGADAAPHISEKISTFPGKLLPGMILLSGSSCRTLFSRFILGVYRGIAWWF